MSTFVPADAIRGSFSAAMSSMYRSEVPLYGDLIDIVGDINAATLAGDPYLQQRVKSAGDMARLDEERHGAIRVGTAAELSALRRIFAVMGMYPVGYYDLSVAGVPVHSTAFRPIEIESLKANPFRIFTSLLRLDLIEDEALREEAGEVLGRRQIISARAYQLLDQAECQGGLLPSEAEEFVEEILETFRWQEEASVSIETYQRLNQAHRLIADIVSFKGPHINHLTPRTLDIDAAHEEMSRRGIGVKAVIEGPPRRSVPILLRQTSFKALEEQVEFADDSTGTHTARFGEIEQRGVALTRKGRALYDACLDEARGDEGSEGRGYEERLSRAFERFPEDPEILRAEGLAHFRYELTISGQLVAKSGYAARMDFATWIDAGWVEAQPITYEDFLPVSAAGIFQSNLGGREQASYGAHSSLASFEAALGSRVLDPFELYAAIEQESISRVAAELGARASFAA